MEVWRYRSTYSSPPLLSGPRSRYENKINLLTLILDSSVVQSLKTPFYFPETLFFCFWYRLSESQGLVRLEGLGKLEKLIHHIGYRNLDLPAYSTVS
jgi:hypothetical protein